MRFSKAPGILARQFFANDYRKLRGITFLVSHMRSFSSLLSHQIGSNPEVAGYFEAHQKYRNWLDLVELADKIHQAGGHAPAGRILFDKILHPLEIRDAILQRKDLKLIVLVREPQATLHSMLKIRSGGIGSVRESIDYYTQRLRDMREILDRRRGRVLYLEAEALIEDSTATLATMSEYLELSVPLTESYQRFPMTGIGKFGDPSAWINYGTIIRCRGEVCEKEHALSADPQFEAMYQDYESFRRYAQAVAEKTILRPAIESLSSARFATTTTQNRAPLSGRISQLSLG